MITKGALYYSFETLSSAIKQWEKENFVNTIQYACVHGGRTPKSCSQGKRPNQSTFIKGCPFGIKVNATSDGKALCITEISNVNDHNHDFNENAFNLMPKQRRLNETESSVIGEMLATKANKKLVQKHIAASTGKTVILKDLHNIAAKQRPLYENTYDELINEMNKEKGAAVDVFADDDKQLQAIYFQTKDMRETFAAYPEMLLIDATYKLNDLRMPLYVMLNVDGLGQSEIVCLWLVATEDKLTISKLLTQFKLHNPAWDKVEVVMADKDMTERDAMMKMLPTAEILICYFHTLRTFRREVSMEKLGISSAQRQVSLEILGKLANAKNESAYNLLYNQFVDTVPIAVTTYYNDNWHAIRHQWVDGLSNLKANFLNRTNNRLESINGKLKSVITRYSGMTMFFKDLMACIQSLSTERDHKASNAFLKVPIDAISSVAERQYQQLLTPFAYIHVQQQFKLAEKVVMSEILNDSAIVKSRVHGELAVTTTACPRGFTSSMLLPCRHVLAVRRQLHMSEYNPNLCSERWTMQYFLKSHRLTRNSLDTGPAFTLPAVEILNKPQRRCVLSEQQKYRRVQDISQKIALMISEQGMDEFQYNLDNLRQIAEFLQEGKKFQVVNFLGQTQKGTDTGSAAATSSSNDPGITLPTVSSSSSQHTPGDVLSTVDTSAIMMQTPSSSIQSFTNDAGSIKFPPKMMKRGRPKGAGLTVIGLPRKRQKKSGPIPFRLRSSFQKEAAILSWFVDSEVVEEVLRPFSDRLTEENEIETLPERIPMKCLDENIAIASVRRHFSLTVGS